jgi:hypothetical protein
MIRCKPLTAAALGAVAFLAAAARAPGQEGSVPPPPPAPVTQEEPTAPLPVPDAPPNNAPATNPSQFVPPGFNNLFTPKVGQSPFRADFRVTWFPEESVVGQGTRLGYEEYDFGFSAPIYQDPANEWMFTGGVRGEAFQTHAILPDTLQPFPAELWNIHLGTAYRHQFDNGWIAGGGVSVGSASDKPFHSINEMTFGANAFLRVPVGDRNAWLFSLAYSPTAQLAFPIPGVAFLWQPTDNFRANIGLPFLLWWRPCDDLTLQLSYMLLTNVHARATYRICGPVRAYIGYDWMNESYFLANRPDVQDRFFYYDQRLTAGVQVNVGKHIMLDFSSGYVFNRYYFEGRQLSDSNANRIDVGDGPFLSFQTWIRW